MNNKADFIQGTTIMGFYSKREISSTLNTRQMETYSQGVRLGLVNGKLLRGRVILC